MSESESIVIGSRLGPAMGDASDGRDLEVVMTFAFLTASVKAGLERRRFAVALVGVTGIDVISATLSDEVGDV
jgi:hypothetical protein